MCEDSVLEVEQLQGFLKDPSHRQIATFGTQDMAEDKLDQMPRRLTISI